jgi:hypothetical protein
MKKTVKKDIAKINEDIKNYMTILEYTDKENSEIDLNISKADIDKLKEKKERFQKDLDLLESLGKEQHNKTDKDASVMSKPAHNLMAYALTKGRKCPWGVIHK